MRSKSFKNRINFKKISCDALRNADSVIRWLLPDGKRQQNEWVALNPRRFDRNLGSFKVNLVSGRWSDFAAGASGGDLISLVAYIRQKRQAEAAMELSQFLGGRHG